MPDTPDHAISPVPVLKPTPWEDRGLTLVRRGQAALAALGVPSAFWTLDSGYWRLRWDASQSHITDEQCHAVLALCQTPNETLVDVEEDGTVSVSYDTRRIAPSDH